MAATYNETMTKEFILVVEDEPSIREVLELYLTRAGFDVKAVSNGREALDVLESGTPDLVLLDLMVPEVDGFQITRHIRERGDTPIIMLTARRGEVDRIAGLEMGADDYVVKPFSPQEVVSRVRAVLRRSSQNGAAKTESALKFMGISIDPGTRMVDVRGKELQLTSTEFDLLLLLAKHPKQVFSREQLLERVWGYSENIDASTLTVHVRRLREKIEKDPSKPMHIITVWGVGSKFLPSENE
jgi:DNA-binding response OmpR family regulator